MAQFLHNYSHSFVAFSCYSPRLQKAGVGHIEFHHDVTSVHAYMSSSLAGRNLGTSYARKLKFGMLLTQT